MKSAICVQLVGPSDQYNVLYKRTYNIHLSHLFGRAHVIYSFLKVLRIVNPLFAEQPDSRLRSKNLRRGLRPKAHTDTIMKK